jgi:hypothetical protein
VSSLLSEFGFWGEKKSEFKNLGFQLLQEHNAPFDFHERTGKDMRMPGQLFFSPLNDGYISIRTGIFKIK